MRKILLFSLLCTVSLVYGEAEDWQEQQALQPNISQEDIQRLNQFFTEWVNLNMSLSPEQWAAEFNRILQHPGFGLPNMVPNGRAEYNHVGKDKEGRVVDGMNDLMGNSARQMRPFYYDKWKDYMDKQYRCCEFDFHTTDPINRKG